MKKFFAIAIIAAAMTACNNSGDTEKSTTDTNTVVPDSNTVTTTPDTSKMATPDTSKMAKPDTSAKK